MIKIIPNRFARRVYSSYKQQRIAHLQCKCNDLLPDFAIAMGFPSTTIEELLRKERLCVKVNAVFNLIRKFTETSSIARRPGLLLDLHYFIIILSYLIITLK